MHSALNKVVAATVAILVVFALDKWSGLGTTWLALLGLAVGAVVAWRAYRRRSLERKRARCYGNSRPTSMQQAASGAPVPGAENSAVREPASERSLATMLRADRVNWMWISYALIAGWAVYEVVATSQLAQSPGVEVAAASPASTSPASTNPASTLQAPARQTATATAAVPTGASGAPSVSPSLVSASDMPPKALMVEASAPAPIAAPRHRLGSSRVCSCSDPRCGCRRSIDRMRPDSTRREM